MRAPKLKKIIVSVMLLTLVFSSLFADTMTKEITAFKQKKSAVDTIPDAELRFRIVPASSSSFDIDASSGGNTGNTGNNVLVPTAARKNSLEVFSWVLSGNHFNSVTISFDFNPMEYIHTDTYTNETTKVTLDYSVKSEYSTTRVGNTTISVNSAPNTVGSKDITYFSDATYTMQYADTVTMDPSDGKRDVSDGHQFISISASMNGKTVITPSDSSAGDYSSRFGEKTVVCDHWNRYGNIYISVDLTEDGKKSDGTTALSGIYYANVVVTLSAAN